MNKTFNIAPHHIYQIMQHYKCKSILMSTIRKNAHSLFHVKYSMKLSRARYDINVTLNLYC